MRFGVSGALTDDGIGAIELGREVEEHGFESVFLPEHTHIPVSRRSPWPGGPDLPEHYGRWPDPFVSLAAMAAVTSRLLLATGVCLVVERDPITLAKEVASLDLVSGGRFVFGIGGGWNREEMEDHGTDPRTRWSLLRERIEAMKVIWTEDEAEYHGRFVDFEPLWSWPKPVQKPYPPILIGGNGPRTLDRVIDYCDGWMPQPDRGPPLSQRIPELQRLAEERGRGQIPVTIFGAKADAQALDSYAGLGVDRVVFGLPAGLTRDALLPLLEERARLAERFRES